MKPLVSIVIPAYNYGKYLTSCIDSILSQTYQDWELIIIDNGSTDNTHEILTLYVDPRISTYRIEANNGPVQAWELGYSKCKGDYFALLPADDAFHPDKLSKQIKFLQEHPDINVVGTYIEEIDETGNPPSSLSHNTEHFNQPIDFHDFKNWRWTQYLCIPTALYSMALCKDANAVPEDGLNNLCDWDFHVKLLGTGANIAVIPEKLTYYRWHRDNTTKKMIDSPAQWIYSYARTYIPVLRKFQSDYLTEIKSSIEALYTSTRYCYFIDDVPVSQRCANLEILLDPEKSFERFNSYQEFRNYSGQWKPDTENRMAIAAIDSSFMNLRTRLLRDAPNDTGTEPKHFFRLERSFLRLQLIKKSYSWRLTAPLRFLQNSLNKIIASAKWRKALN